MKKALAVIALISVISLVGCGKSNKTTVAKTPDGKTVTTVTSPEGHIISRTTK